MPTIKKPARKKSKKPRKWSNRQLRQKVYNSREWRELRAWYIAHHPLCERCSEQGRTSVATAIHHKTSFAKYFQNGEITEKSLQVAFDPDNLMSVCEDCHLTLHHQHKRKYDIKEFFD